MARDRLQDVARKNAAGSEAFRRDLLNIARTTLSSKILTHDKDHFAELAVDAVLRLKGSTDLEAIHIIKKAGGTLKVEPWFAELKCLGIILPAANPCSR